MLHRHDLRVYQTFLGDKIKQCFVEDPKRRLPGIIAALEPGAGKTAAALTAVKDLHEEGLLKKVLVVAPLLVAQTTWPDEFGEWSHLQDMPFTLLRVEEDDPEIAAISDAAYAEALSRHQEAFEIERESEVLLGLSKGDARKAARAASDATPAALAEKERQEAVAKAKDAKLARLAETDTLVHIVNKEALRWLWDHLGRGARWPYDMMIVDDVRETRSGKKRVKREKDDGTRAKAPLSRFGIMAAARKHMKATIVLTGTPTPKGLEDLWGLAYLVDLGDRLLPFKTPFLKRWFHIDTRTFKAEPRDYAFGEIMPRVKDIMFSLDPADYPQLPPYQVVPIRVRLPDDVMKAYRKFKREMVSEEYDVEAVNGGVLHGKLLQFANGSMFREDGNDVPIHDVKIDALKTLVQELNGTPLLVAYTYRFDVERIMTAFPKAVHLTPENAGRVVRDWNADKIPLLLCHRASAGHGLNMQKGTGHMCEYGLTADAELYLQFLKRIWRPGRKGTLFNHVIMSEDTIDDEIFPQYLDPKILTQMRVMEAVRVSFQQDALLADLL